MIACSKNKVEQKNQQSKTETIVEKEKNNNLHNEILRKDSLLFDVGFNKIDTSQIELLLAEDFEFYHDEHGITESKQAFISGINGLRNLPFKTWRTLVDGSMEVFPLYSNNKRDLYGVVQNGVHDFYQQEEGEAPRKTNIAKFTHLWILSKGDWKLKRVLSYDHRVPEE